jgi:hypothetical protein
MVPRRGLILSRALEETGFVTARERRNRTERERVDARKKELDGCVSRHGSTRVDRTIE